jgi:hypothetical protein
MSKLYLFDPQTQTEYIEIDTASVPYTVYFRLWDASYGLYIRYNEAGGFYTVDLSDANNVTLSYGAIVRYGRPLFGPVEDERFPLPVIIPYSTLGTESEVTRENLGKTVQLFLFDRKLLQSAASGASSSATASDASGVVIIPPVRPPSGGVGDKYSPYYHMHPIEGVVDLAVRLESLGHRPIPLDDVAAILAEAAA